ncbi:MAG: hypothetical protein R3C49_21115 [Planctomycetaceae bacterium]
MPGNRYVQVLNTYLTRRLLMLASVGMLAISVLPIAVWWLVGKAGSADSRQSMFGFFLAFPAMFLGAHVKQQLATHEASLVPGYRGPHLVVAALTFLVPVLCAFVAAPAAGGSIVGHASLLLLVCLMFFHLMAAPSGWNGVVVAFIYLPMLITAFRLVVQQVLEGKLPGLAWCLLSAEAAIGVLLFHRLANLTEDDPSYGDVIPMNAWDMRAAEVRRRNRAQLQKSPKMMLTLIAAESKRLDKLTAEPATSRRQRVALLQMAGDWPISLMSVFVMIIVMESLPLLAPRVVDRLNPITTNDALAMALVWPIMLSLGVAWALWLPQSQRLSRLGYESLRPSSRREWVQENGLAIIRNTLRMQPSGWWLRSFCCSHFCHRSRTSPVIVQRADLHRRRSRDDLRCGCLDFIVRVHVLEAGGIHDGCRRTAAGVAGDEFLLADLQLADSGVCIDHGWRGDGADMGGLSSLVSD